MLRASRLTTPLRAQTGISWIESLRRYVPRDEGPFHFIQRTLKALEIRAELAVPAAGSIAASRPLVVVCNHPFGGLDGLLALSILELACRDVRVLAKQQLLGVHEIASLLFRVRFEGKHAKLTRADEAAARTALRWLKAGHCLLALSAGQASQCDFRARCMTDAPWSQGFAPCASGAGSRVADGFPRQQLR